MQTMIKKCPKCGTVKDTVIDTYGDNLYGTIYAYYTCLRCGCEFHIIHEAISEPTVDEEEDE